MEKILIIDDSKLDSAVLSSLLKNMGFKPVCAFSGKEGISMAMSEKPSLILLDVVMPEMNGIEVVSILSRRESTKDIPVIMVTSLSKPEYVKAALDAGALDYVKKPYSEIELLARIRSALRHARLYRELKKMAVTDSLTGLYNHAYIMGRVEEQIRFSNRYGTSFTFIMADIDHFKMVNDNYGHPAGDCVLRNVAKLLTNFVRETDIVGRYGGEEFSIIMPMTRCRDGCVAADRLRESVKAFEFRCANGNVINVTMSFGVSSYPDDSLSNSSDVVVAADKALYEAKRSGRNAVYCFENGKIFRMGGEM